MQDAQRPCRASSSMRRPQVMQRFSFNLKSRSLRDDAAANLPGESPDDSGESPPHLFSVAQICNLLYRRSAFCGTSILRRASGGRVGSASAFELSDALPITNRRYGILEAAATKVAQTSQSAVSRISKSATHPNSIALPTWKSATQQVWKPALRRRAGRYILTDAATQYSRVSRLDFPKLTQDPSPGP